MNRPQEHTYIMIMINTNLCKYEGNICIKLKIYHIGSKHDIYIQHIRRYIRGIMYNRTINSYTKVRGYWWLHSRILVTLSLRHNTPHDTTESLSITGEYKKQNPAIIIITVNDFNKYYETNICTNIIYKYKYCNFIYNIIYIIQYNATYIIIIIYAIYYNAHLINKKRNKPLMKHH